MDTSHAEDQHKEYIGAELRRFGREAGEEKLQVVSPFEPAGDQPQAIEKLAQGIEDGLRYQTLLGVTGSGKTFSMAKTIEKLNRPTLIMEPNKTLAAQVASEMKELFPNNAVVYFVSYYDYYQPEAYVPQSDTYIEKDASINEEVEKLRHQATSSLLSRRDVIVVASVSCIYGIGSPQDYAGLAPNVDKSVPLERDDFIKDLIDVQYDRNDYDLQRGMFRVRGDVVDVFPPYAENPLRIEFFGDEVESISEVSNVTGEVLREFDAIPIWPASHYVTERPKITHALTTISEELEARVKELKEQFPQPDEIVTEADKKAFVKLFGDYLKVENILQNYDEFTHLKDLQNIDKNNPDALESFKDTHFLTDETLKEMLKTDVLQERTVQDYRSAYNDIRDWFRREKEGKAPEASKIDWDDVVFEVDLLKSQEIDLDYILELVFEHNKKTKDKDALINEVRRIIRSSVGNRAKEGLIVDFVQETDLDPMKDKSSIISAFYLYAQERQKEEAADLINEEKLNEEAAKRYIQTSLKHEFASDNGTDLNAILPKMSPLNPQYLTKKQSVFQKISAFIEKFKGVGGNL